MLQWVPLILTMIASAVALANLVTHFRARQDLSRAVAGASRDDRTRLLQLLDKGDVQEAVRTVSRFLDALPPRERAAAEDALCQRSRRGQSTYVEIVAASAERLERTRAG